MGLRILEIQTLRAGAKLLGIPTKLQASSMSIERAIMTKLAEDPTYGAYSCAWCGRDVVDLIPTCPFCMCMFVPTTPSFIDEEDIPKPKPQKQLPPAQHAPATQDLRDAQTEEDAEFEESPAEDIEDVEEDEWGEVEVIEDLVPWNAPTPSEIKKPGVIKAKVMETRAMLKTANAEVLKRPPKPKKKTSTKPKKKVSKAAAKVRFEQKERELEKKRALIISELPYTRETLETFKRTAVIMIAGLLGIHRPMYLGDKFAIIDRIMEVQKEKFG